MSHKYKGHEPALYLMGEKGKGSQMHTAQRPLVIRHGRRENEEWIIIGIISIIFWELSTNAYAEP